MKYGELKKLLYYKEKENEGIFLPNEIFDDFRKIDGASSNKAFAFSYYFLISYLYRYCKYINRHYEVETLKEILGYARTNKTMNKLIKKGGILDEMGYTSQTNDAPVEWEIDEDGECGVLFIYESEQIVSMCGDESGRIVEEELIWFRENDVIQKNKRNKQIKVPRRGLHRDDWSEDENYFDGTFYEVLDTTMIPVQAFLICMTNEKLGVEGFWVFSFIKFKSEYYGGNWDCALKDMIEIVGINKTKLSEISKELEVKNMITNSHEDYVMGLPSNWKVDANSYGVRTSAEFLVNGKNKIEIREVKGWNRYKRENGLEEVEDEDGQMVVRKRKRSDEELELPW